MKEIHERIRIKDIAKLADVSVGTVDRVLHNRSGVSEESKKKVENILGQLDYQPNMYASALATNKKYLFACLLPTHREGEYWTAVEEGINAALKDYSDFNISIHVKYYDPYIFSSFFAASNELLHLEPDGIMLSPSDPKMTRLFTEKLQEKNIPFVFLDFNMPNLNPLAFYGQNSVQSGFLSAKMLMMMAGSDTKEVVVFRQIKDGIIGSNQQEYREVGFRQYMKTEFSQCKILEMDLHARDKRQEELAMDLFFAKHPEIKAGITFNSKVFIVGEYMRTQNLLNFILIGYDLLNRNVACLKEGFVSMLIAQKPEDQGYLGILSLCNHLIFKREITQINYMPIDLLTAENIDFYMNFKR